MLKESNDLDILGMTSYSMEYDFWEVSSLGFQSSFWKPLHLKELGPAEYLTIVCSWRDTSVVLTWPFSSAVHQVVLSCVHLVLRSLICPFSLQILEVPHDFYSPLASLWIDLVDDAFDDVGLAGFKNSVNGFFIIGLSCSLPFVFYCFLHLSFLFFLCGSS